MLSSARSASVSSPIANRSSLALGLWPVKEKAGPGATRGDKREEDGCVRTNGGMLLYCGVPSGATCRYTLAVVAAGWAPAAAPAWVAAAGRTAGRP